MVERSCKRLAILYRPNGTDSHSAVRRLGKLLCRLSSRKRFAVTASMDRMEQEIRRVGSLQSEAEKQAAETVN
jgi:hypothetical protein